MPYTVFSQSPERRVDPAALINMARRYFRIDVDVLSDETTPTGNRLRIRVSGGQPRLTGEFAITARARTEADLDAARLAEVRGRAGGMAALAERCPTVWDVDDAGSDELLTLELCALLASVGLGPVMPSDHSTLFGVRGARERAELKR